MRARALGSTNRVSKPALSKTWALLLGALLLGACSCPRVCHLPPADAVHLDHTPSLNAAVAQSLAAQPGEPIDILALSGGGQNGAFAAGVLKSWREVGRPEFRIVTGVSIGAMLAPFAFIGTPDADDLMQNAFEGLTRDDVFPPRAVIAIPMAGSLYKPEGVARILRRRVTDDVIRQVAEASRGGDRLLLVGTTNLDSGSLHIWDMGQVARLGRYDRFRKILLACASVPIFLPAVELNGCLHADAAVTQQIFVPTLASSREVCGDTPIRVHAIANTSVYVDRTCQPRAILKRGTRALITMMRSTMIDNLWRLWGRATRAGASVRMIIVPEGITPTDQFLSFEPAAMAQLFRRGYASGRDPSTWLLEPPAHRVETTR